MDKRIHYRMVLDCETAPCDKTLEEVRPDNMFVYDVGWAICDKRGNVYLTRSFVNADIFLDEKELMKSAYYAEKIPKYWAEIKSGKRTLTSFYNIRKTLFEDIAEWCINEVYAHNMRFDYGALNNTQRWLTKSRFRSFFPKNVIICDTLKMATDVIATMPTYKNFCIENGFMTSHKTPRPQLKAETLIRFITRDLDFEEEHTGLEDVLIEVQILAFCYSRHKKMRKKLWED